MSGRDLLADVFSALTLLTRLPLPTGLFTGGLSTGGLFTGKASLGLRRGHWAYPLAGWVVGTIGAATLQIALFVGLAPWPAAALTVTAVILVTGGLHEDGLADMADGLGGGTDRDSRLRIMRDSRIGTYGALALLVSLIIRLSALVALVTTRGGAHTMAVLIVTHMVSRSAMLGVMTVLPPARSDGLGAGAGRPGRAAVIVGMGFGLCAAGALVFFGATDGDPVQGTVRFSPGLILLALGAVVLAVAGVTRLARRYLGGYTGDVLGATEQVAEAVFLTAMSVA